MAKASLSLHKIRLDVRGPAVRMEEDVEKDNAGVAMDAARQEQQQLPDTLAVRGVDAGAVLEENERALQQLAVRGGQLSVNTRAYEKNLP